MGKDIINFLKLCASRAITKIGGGDRGIRTLDTVACIRDFESRAFNQLCHISVTGAHYIYIR